MLIVEIKELTPEDVKEQEARLLAEGYAVHRPLKKVGLFYTLVLIKEDENAADVFV